MSLVLDQSAPGPHGFLFWLAPLRNWVLVWCSGKLKCLKRGNTRGTVFKDIRIRNLYLLSSNLAKVLHVKYRLFLLGRRKIFPVFKGFIGELARKIEETRLGTNVMCSSVYKVLEIRGTWLKVFYEQSNSAETANLRVQCDEQLIWLT